jgi:hypothetical protein
VELQRTITLDVERCFECGRFWAVERGVLGRCPCCADDRASKLVDELAAAERVNRALRGALTKAKGATHG